MIYNDFNSWVKEMDLNSQNLSVEEFNNLNYIFGLLNDKLSLFSEYFENQFYNSQFEKLFPFNSYGEVLKEILDINSFDVNCEDIELICKYGDYIIKTLPFFKMCSIFKEIIKSYIHTENFELRTNFNFNPFTKSIKSLGEKIFENKINLSSNFINRYWKSYYDTCFENNDDFKYNNLFVINKFDDGTFEASSWYKLAYHYLRKEEGYSYIDETESPSRYHQFYDNDNNIFYKREKMIKYISELFIEQGNESFIDIGDYLLIEELPQQYQSLFSIYLYTETYALRSYVKKTHLIDNCQITPPPEFKDKDIWTMGIFFDVCKMSTENFFVYDDKTTRLLQYKWGNVLELPTKYKNLDVF